MKPAVEKISGKIAGYDHEREELIIRVPYKGFESLVGRKYNRCIVEISDRRMLSDSQRRMIYSLLRCISDYAGQELEETKEIMKYKFLETGVEPEVKDFSLSNVPMSLACEFQRYLVRFIVEFDIPCDVNLLEMVQDMDDYMYACLMSHKCAICGKEASLHFIGNDAVESGADFARRGMMVYPLCFEHHDEAHTAGRWTFRNRYHLNGGVEINRNILNEYGIEDYVRVGG